MDRLGDGVVSDGKIRLSEETEKDADVRGGRDGAVPGASQVQVAGKGNGAEEESTFCTINPLGGIHI